MKNKMKDCICIVCPKGCHLHIDDDLNVSGNSCLRGEIYGKNEATNPMRNLTSTVKLSGSVNLNRLPVKTSNDIPKGKMFEVMKELTNIEAKVPVVAGDVIVKNILGLNVDVIATRTVKR